MFVGNKFVEDRQSQTLCGQLYSVSFQYRPNTGRATVATLATGDQPATGGY
jgi:hypothetical protein